MPAHIAFPLRIVNGRLATVEQGETPDLIGQVRAVCLTEPGYFTRRPELGLYPQQHLEGGSDLAEIRRQLDLYVPDAEHAEEEDPAALADALSLVSVQVRAR